MLPKTYFKYSKKKINFAKLNLVGGCQNNECRTILGLSVMLYIHTLHRHKKKTNIYTSFRSAMQQHCEIHKSVINIYCQMQYIKVYRQGIKCIYMQIYTHTHTHRNFTQRKASACLEHEKKKNTLFYIYVLRLALESIDR